jgi:hypothetical protein
MAYRIAYNYAATTLLLEAYAIFTLLLNLRYHFPLIMEIAAVGSGLIVGAALLTGS